MTCAFSALGYVEEGLNSNAFSPGGQAATTAANASDWSLAAAAIFDSWSNVTGAPPPCIDAPCAVSLAGQTAGATDPNGSGLPLCVWRHLSCTADQRVSGIFLGELAWGSTYRVRLQTTRDDGGVCSWAAS